MLKCELATEYRGEPSGWNEVGLVSSAVKSACRRSSLLECEFRTSDLAVKDPVSSMKSAPMSRISSAVDPSDINELRDD